MANKIVYKYDAKTMLYVAPMTLDDTYKTPKTHEWAIPAYTTESKPPKEKEGYEIKWNGSAWGQTKIPAPPEPEPPTLDEAKAAKISELKMHRDTEEVEPIQTEKGIFDYDDKSRDRLSIARQALEDNGGKGTITWTTADNQRVPLGVSDFATINGAAATRSNALHIKYNELKDQVNACTTIDEVEAISWEA